MPSPHAPMCSSLFLQCSVDHRDLHSFPTRRSSDLEQVRPLEPGHPMSLPGSGNPVNQLGRQVTITPDFPADLLDFRSPGDSRSEEHTSELQSRPHLVCRLLLEKKKTITHTNNNRTD